MKKQLLISGFCRGSLFFLCMLFIFSSAAQIKIFPDTSNGGTRKVFETFDSLGIRTITDEYYDSSGRLRKKEIQTSDLEGNMVFKIIIYRPGHAQVKESESEQKRTPKGKKIYTEEKVFDEKGDSVIRGYREWRQENGKWLYQEFDPEKQEYDPETQSFSVAHAETTENNICAIPKVEAFAAYSVLVGSFYPLGALLDIRVNIRDHIGVALDASYHRGKDGGSTTSRSLIMIDGIYVTGDREDCDKNMFAEIRVLAGIMNEKVEIGTSVSKGHSAVFGAGLGVMNVITKGSNVKLRAQGDLLYFISKIHFRFGLGVVFPISQKF